MTPRAAVLVLAAICVLALAWWLLNDGEDPAPNEEPTSSSSDADGDAPLLAGTGGPVPKRPAEEATPKTPERAPPESGGDVVDGAVKITGTVFDGSGTPVPGAVVTAHRVPWPALPIPTFAAKTTSDDEGHYVLRVSPKLYIVIAALIDPPDVVRARSHRHEATFLEDTELDLHIIAPDAQIIVAFELAEMDADASFPNVLVTRLDNFEQQRSGDARRVTFDLWRGDVVSFSLKCPDGPFAVLPGKGDEWREYTIVDSHTSLRVEVKDAVERRTMRVLQLATLTGSITVPEGATVARPPVVHVRSTSSWAPGLETVAAGSRSFRFGTKALPGRALSVFVAPLETREGGLVGMLEPLVPGALRAGQTLDLDLRLVSIDATVTGSVHGPMGEPIASATVTLVQELAPGVSRPVWWRDDGSLGRWDGRSAFRFSRRATTSADGRFSARALPGVSTTFMALPKPGAELTPSYPSVIEVAAGQDIGVLQCDRPGSLSGQVHFVRSETATPVAFPNEVTLRAVPMNADRKPVYQLMKRITVRRENGVSFRFTGLAPGRYRVLGSVPILEQWDSPLAEVDVGPDEEVSARIVVRTR